MTNTSSHSILDAAQGLYLEGIRDGNMQTALDKYTGDRYTQHSTGVADGKEGFIEFFTPFLERNPDRHIEIKRSIVDGPNVLLHVYQSLNGGEAQWVTADIFDTDENGKIVEHWDVIAPFVADTGAGRSMVDGDHEVSDLDKTQDNKALVRNFVDTSLLGHVIDANTDTPHGFDTFTAPLAARPDNVVYKEVHHLLGQGNFVGMLSNVSIGDDDHAIIDIFQLKDGAVVDHWSVDEQIGPKETWNNSGKF